MARPADKRDRILEAALKVFCIKGYAAASIPEIARAAGIAQGTIYVYFKDKSHLVNELYRYWKLAKVQAIEMGSQTQAPRQRFERMWYSYINFGLNNDEGLSFLENHYHVDYLDEESQRLTLRFIDQIMAFIGEMIDCGAFKKISPPVLMAVFHGAARELLNLIHHHKLEASPEVLAQAEQCCWEAVRA